MAKAITLRLDEDDHVALRRQADRLRVAPGTLARMLVHAGLTEEQQIPSGTRSAIARLASRSQRQPAADAVVLVGDAREAFGADT
jgi:hypothetical protein